MLEREKHFSNVFRFITNLDSSTIEAIAATAPINHAPALRDLFYKHLAGKSSIGVNIPVSFTRSNPWMYHSS
jgi:hypothetical protein